MTDQQLYLAIGIPTLAVLVGILVNVGYFVALNGRIGGIEARIGGVEGRMSAIEDRFDSRVHSLELKFDTKMDILTGKVVELDNRLIRLEEHFRHS